MSFGEEPRNSGQDRIIDDMNAQVRSLSDQLLAANERAKKYRALAEKAANQIIYASDYVVPPIVMEREGKAILEEIKKVETP